MDTSYPGRSSDDSGEYGIGGLIARADAADGLDTRTLDVGDTVVIRTCNSFYTLRLTDPEHGAAVATSDGKFVTDESRAGLVGATLSGRGTSVKLGWVLLGFKIVLSVPGGYLVTSRVRSVTVNGKPLIPVDGVH